MNTLLFTLFVSLLFSLLSTTSAQLGTNVTTLSFCYGEWNTLTTSPYYLWSVSVSGRMTVVQLNATDVTKGWLVTSMSGTRILTSKGGVVTTQAIIGLAPQYSYGYNNNQLIYTNNVTLAGFDTSSYAIAYQVRGAPVFAGGVFLDAAQNGATNANGFIQINGYLGAYAPTGSLPGAGVHEMNQPVNDGATNSLQSFFSVSVLSSKAAVITCPYSVPLITPNAAIIAQFAATQQFSMCTQHVGGPHQEIYNGGNWTVTTSVIVTTSTYAGSVGGRTAYLILNLSGTRAYYTPQLQSTINVLGVGSITGLYNLAQTQAGDGSFGYEDTTNQINGDFGGFSNNVYYPTFPYLDTLGVNLYTDNAIFDILFGEDSLLEYVGGSTSTQVYRLGYGGYSIYYGLTEYLLDYSYYSGNEVVYQNNYFGSFVSGPYTGVSVAKYGGLCSFAPYQALGTSNTISSSTIPTTFQWCYYFDNTVSGGSVNLVSAYGTMTAFGPITRDGRTDAYQILGINGIRNVTVNGVSIVQNIVSLTFPGIYDTTDNWVFKSSPYVDYGGFQMQLSAPANWSNSASLKKASSVYVSVERVYTTTPPTYTEYDYSGSGATPNTANFIFSFSPYSSGNLVNAAACSAADSNVAPPVSTAVYSFCYYNAGPNNNYAATTQGTMTVLNTPILGPNGGYGYPVIAMNGTRQFADNNGFLSVNPILGPSSDYQASVPYFSKGSTAGNEVVEVPDQLIYPNKASGIPGGTYWDQEGIIYSYGGTPADSVGVSDTLAQIIALKYDVNTATNYTYFEEIIYKDTLSSTTVTYYYDPLWNGNGSVVADNGVSGSAATVAQQQCGAAPTQQFSFCYTIINTLTTSPWLTWNVTVSGLMNISGNYTQGEYAAARNPTYGYQVLAATGTRTVTYQGKTVSGSFTLAQVNEYQFNDNIINLQYPYLNTNYHAISFKMTSGPAYFADGPLASGSPYFSINGYTTPKSNGAGITESDLPINDGTSQVVYSSFYMAFDYFGTNTCPPTGLPAYVPPTAAQLAAYTGPTSQVAFCWSHTGGPGGYGTIDGGAWQITSAGIFTLSGYLGTTADGRSAYKILNATGTRTYLYENGTTQVVAFVGTGSVFQMGQTSALATGQYAVGSFGTNFYGNNIYYTTYPQLDARGVVLVGTAQFVDEQEGTISKEGADNENVIRVLIQPGFNNMLEYLWDPPTAYIFTNNGGMSQFAAYTGQNITAFGQQCLYQAGSPSTYAYCYWLTGNNFATGAPYTVYAYGTAIANGPLPRNYGTAVAVTAMTGVRTVSVNGQIFVQNIMNIQYPNQDLITNTANDNLIYTSGQILDGLGLTFSLNPQPLNGLGNSSQANGFSPNSDINVWIATQPGYNYGMYESSANYSSEVNNLAYIYTQTYGFTVAPFSLTTKYLAQCSAPTSVVPIIPPLQTYSFCYSLSGGVTNTNTIYTVSVAGTITVYGTPITNNGRIGYAIQNITGTRRFQNVNGQTQTSAIAGVSADWIAGQQGWTFNQIFYPVAPFFDSTGILMKLNSTGQSASGAIFTRDPVIKLSYPTYPAGSLGETIYATSGQTYVLNTNAGAVVNVVGDNGASAAANSILATCASTTTAAVTPVRSITVNFCYGVYNTLKTSPYGQWSVSVSGRMTMNQVSATDITAGWLVTGMSGTRTLVSQGGVVVSQPIVGLAPVGTYGYNNNRLLWNLSNLAVFDTSSYALAYQVKGPAQFAGGIFPDSVNTNVAGANGYIQLNGYASGYAPSGSGINEMNQPVNDKITNTLTSYWFVQQLTTATDNIFNCPYSVPVASTALTYAFAQTQQFSVCVTHTGGPNGDGTVNGGNWTITTSAIVTVAGYAGTTTNGRTGYLITGITGTRTYTSQSLTATVNIIAVGGTAALFNLDQLQVGDFSLGSSDYVLQTEGFGGWANNVLYTSFPYFDQLGAAFYTDAAITQELFGQYIFQGGSASTQTYRIGTIAGSDGSLVNVNEFLIDYSWLTGYALLATNSGGVLVVAPYTGTPTSVFAGQCAFAPYSQTYQSGYNYGLPLPNTIPTTYQWCYYIDNTATGGSANIVSAYGQMSAFGPVTRNGRSDAYQVLSLSGVRTVTINGASTVQNIIALQYPNSYGDYVLNVNDNFVFKSAPNIDGNGLMMTMANSTFFPNNASLVASNRPTVNLALFAASSGSTPTFAELDGFAGIFGNGNYPYGATPASSKFAFAFSPYSAGSPAQPNTCQSLNGNVPAPSSTTVYSFCYYHLGSQRNFASTTQGTLTVLNAGVVGPNGQVGNVVINMNGTRQVADNLGDLSVNPITGVADDYQGAQVGYTVLGGDAGLFFSSPDQLVYPTGNSGLGSVFDQNGLLYRYGGSLGVTPGYTDTVAQIARLKYDNTSNNYGYLEEVIFLITTNASTEFTGNLGQFDNSIVPTYYSQIELHGNSAIIADNGVSGQAGTAAQLSCAAPAVQQFSFCYTITNTLTSSPWLTWTVTVSGLMNVSANYTQGEYNNAFGYNSYGYQVMSASGTRTIQYQGKTATGQFTLANVNEYQFNDNIINLQYPYLVNDVHSISFKMTNGAAVFADGPLANQSPYFSINGFSFPQSYGAGITESDLPVNDGLSQVIYSQMYVAFDYYGTNTCPATGLPAYVAPSAQQVSAYNAAGSKIQFCWSHTGGPGGYGTYDGSAWQITSSGYFTLSGYAGTTTDGRTAYKIIGVSGSRTYLYNNGSAQVVPFSGVGSVFQMGQASALATNQYDVGSFGSYFYGNNIYYTTYPQLDNWGVVLVGTAQFVEEYEGISPTVSFPQGSANENVIRVLIQPGFNNMLEYLWDAPTNYIWTNNGGYAEFTAYTGQDPTAFGQQCLYQAGSPAQYSYCYWLSGNNFVTGAPYLIYAYGTAIANGPNPRAYGTAVAVTAMTGVRSVTVNGFTNVQNIMNIQYPNQDLGTNTANTNLIFVTGPAPLQVLDGLGLTFTMNSQPLNGQGGAWDANGIQSGSDINIWMSPSTGYGLYESSGSYQDEINTNAYIYTNSYNFSVAPFTPGGQLQQCLGNPSVPVVPALQTYSFCYALASNNGSQQFVVAASGTLSVYTTPITTNGRIGYAVQSVIGTRQWQNSNGQTQKSTITGVSADWIAGQQGWTFDQIFYPTAPFFSASGLLIKYTGNGTLSASGAVIARDPVIKLFYNQYPGGSLGEEIYTITNQTYTLNINGGANVNFIADNGVTAATIGASCGVTFPYNFQSGVFSGQGSAASSSSSSSSSSNSLSNGAIIGLVLGLVFGIIICCLLCIILYCLVAGAAVGGKAASQPVNGSKYSAHQDEASKYTAEPSAVEMQTNEHA